MAEANHNRTMTNLYVGGMSAQELRSLFSCDVAEDDDYYDVIAHNLAFEDPAYLINHVHEFRGPRLRGALFGIGFIQGSDDAAATLLHTYLDGADELATAEAIDALLRRKHLGSMGQITDMSRHPSPYVRGAVLRYLRSVRGSDSFAALIAALNDPHYIVRENAVDELAGLGDKSAVPHIQALAEDPHPDVRQAVESALSDLA